MLKYKPSDSNRVGTPFYCWGDDVMHHDRFTPATLRSHYDAILRKALAKPEVASLFDSLPQTSQFQRYPGVGMQTMASLKASHNHSATSAIKRRKGY